MDIQPDFVAKGIRVWRRRHCSRIRERREVDIGTDDKAGDEDIAADLQVVLRPLQPDGRVGRSAYAKVAEAHIAGAYLDIAIDPLLPVDVASDLDLAAAGDTRHILEVESILDEHQRPVQLADAAGEFLVGQADVGKLHLAAEVRVLDAAPGGHVEVDLAGRENLGVEELCKLHVNGPGSLHIQVAFAQDVCGTLRGDVSILPADVQWIEREDTSAQ